VYRQRLGDLLTDQKERSGFSFAVISRKTRLSKSAVHRYCAGQSVPPTFGPIESIALACKASRTTIDALYAAWTSASASEVAAPVAEHPPASAPGTAAEEIPAGGADRPSRRHVWFAATAAGIAVLTAAAVIVFRLPSRPEPIHAATGASQQINGPAWELAPRQVPGALFGATVNSSSGNMPGFELGAVRFWDSETRWSQIESQPRVFDWRNLDRLVAGAGRAGLPALYVIGGTPAWAAPDGARSVYPEGARSAPPDDLTEWDTFIRALVQRYRGRIEAYELWVLATDRRMYTGTPETLFAMTRRASAIIRSTDPKATVVCPGMGNLWTAEGRQFLQRFAELGGYDHCDVAGIKLYQQAASDPPETMLNLLGDVDRVFHQAGVHPRLWNTGTTYTIALQQPLEQATARSYAVRFFLVGLYGRHYHLERMYFYNWGGTKIPIVLQADGGAPTPAALAIQTLKRWLASAQSRSCGHGSRAGLPENAWQCELIVGEGSTARRTQIRWTHQGVATARAEDGITAVRYLDGRIEHPRRGDTLRLTGDPILIEFA
jgi:hypothetical protein